MIRDFGVHDVVLLLSGLEWTFALTFLAFIGSFLAGMLLLALLTGRGWALRLAALAWIQLVEGIPLLGHLFLIFFGLALFGIDIARWIAAALALSIYGSAFLADIWRGAFFAVPDGQWEGASALGLDRRLALWLVIYPQAFRMAIPPTVGFLVQLIKNSSLASAIGVVELTREAALVNGATFRPFLIYGCVCVLYFVLCLPLTSASRMFERRLATAR